MQPAELRQDLRGSTDADMKRRRGVVAVSLFGMANMAAVTLLQTGVLKHLPDPPIHGFDSDRVNTSDLAYSLGAPDGSLSLAGLAANIPLAGFGGADRAEKMPWAPIAAAVKSGLEAAAAGWYFYQMPAKEKAWCAYCIGGALANAAIFALTIPEACRAWRSARSR